MQFDPNIPCGSRVMSILLTEYDQLDRCSTKPPPSKRLLWTNVYMLQPCGYLTSWLSCMWCFLVFLSLSLMVSWIRCGIWLYGFLIFAIFLTFTLCIRMKSLIKIYRAVQELWAFSLTGNQPTYRIPAKSCFRSIGMIVRYFFLFLIRYLKSDKFIIP